jgi:excisionase family DNA binding protein
MANLSEASYTPRLLTTRQVAATLGCSRAWVHELARRRVLEAVRLVPLGDLRFRIEDVERLIAGSPGETP